MSVVFDGNDDWINIPDLSFDADFTVEAWVKVAQGIDALDAIMGQEGLGPDINFFEGKVRLYTASAPTNAITAQTEIKPDTWTHVAITRSGSNLSLYLNGLLDATGEWHGNFPVQALGRGNRSSQGNLKGELDEVRVWNVARSGSDIKANYNQGLNADSTGLVGYWNFNESGQIITDSSGSSHHGSLGIGKTADSDDPLHVVSTAPITESCDSTKIDAPRSVSDSSERQIKLPGMVNDQEIYSDGQFNWIGQPSARVGGAKRSQDSPPMSG